MQELYNRIDQRFSINEETGCWKWQGTLTKSGYAEITWQGQHFLVHRVMYERYYGAIPPKYQIHHTCNNPSCIYPAHLQCVTQRENLLLKLGLIHLREERLFDLFSQYDTILLFPGLIVPSTELASLWNCRSDKVSKLLESMAYVYDDFHYDIIRSGRQGPKPMLFRMWCDERLLRSLQNDNLMARDL